jgi:hypothetical protein
MSTTAWRSLPITAIAVIVFVGCSVGLAQAQSLSAADLSGTWTDTSDGSVKWILNQDVSTIHIKEVRGTEVKADYSCQVDGPECKLRDSGREEMTSLYFNGPKLVELRTRGEDVVKRRFTASADGKTLTVEVIPIAPSGKTETLTFAR